MSTAIKTTLSRRRFLVSAAAAASAPLWSVSNASGSQRPSRQFALRAAPADARILPAPREQTGVWAYNGSLPGPVLRVRQGERLRVQVENALPEATTVHWHGVRTPNAMDGVPHLTQPPIAPGETFTYEFDALDAGTFWYHPHLRSLEQVDRGLSGALVVEEPEPIKVDREFVWILDDWRLTPAGQISGDFDHPHDLSHGGRFGNTITINGRIPADLPVRRGERIRLRLINAANARIFGLEFGGHAPVVIALDGQPVTPHRPAEDRIVLGPAMRADIVVDCTGQPGERLLVADRYYEGLEYDLLAFAYAEKALRDKAPDWPLDLLPNPLPEPDLASALRHDVVFSGGMMGRMVMQQMGIATDAGRMGSMGAMMRGDGLWFLNGVAAEGHVPDPMLTLRRNQSCILAMTNATAWPHPIHLQGHSFRVIARNGQPTPHREWLDTVLMAPREKVEIAFVADNPGDWMFHCHILEHQAAGMMGVIRVT